MATKTKKPLDWALAPAPESKDHFTLKSEYDLFIGGKWMKPCAAIHATPSTVMNQILHHLRRASFGSAAIILLIITTNVKGQSPGYEVGLHGGPSLGWLGGNKMIDASDQLLGPAAGLTFQYDLTNTFGLRIGVGYQSKGSRADVKFIDIHGNPIFTGISRTDLDYILLPLMVRASFGNGPRFSIGVGPYAGHLMRARHTWSGEGLVGGSEDLTANFERWDLGISASVGASFSLVGDLWLSTELRYDKGLNNIGALPVIDDGSIRTNAVALLVGLIYRFGDAVQQPPVEP